MVVTTERANRGSNRSGSAFGVHYIRSTENDNNDEITLMTSKTVMTRMPIEIDAFETATEDELREPTNGERVLRFLLDHRDKAFTPVEIAEGAEVKRNSVGTVLRRLEDRDLVRHKGDYWAIGEEDSIRRASEFRRVLEDLDDRFGHENLDEWRNHATENER